jgi:septum formation protein
MPAERKDLQIMLASASPRRRELLELTGWNFSVCSSPVAETQKPGEEARDLAQRLALSKAQSARVACPDKVVTLAADTLVVYKHEVLGKPADPDQAASMLQRLRGQDHHVITAIALDASDQAPQVVLCESLVPMRDYGPDEVAAYVAGGSPFDKAGAYGIQDPDFQPVDRERFTDCYANVMGLPLCHVVWAFRQMGYEPPEHIPQRCRQFTGYDCTIYSNISRGEL